MSSVAALLSACPKGAWVTEGTALSIFGVDSKDELRKIAGTLPHVYVEHGKRVQVDEPYSRHRFFFIQKEGTTVAHPVLSLGQWVTSCVALEKAVSNFSTMDSTVVSLIKKYTMREVDEGNGDAMEKDLTSIVSDLKVAKAVTLPSDLEGKEPQGDEGYVYGRAGRPHVAEGEVYVRADGKKVRRVKRSSSASAAQVSAASLAGFLGANKGSTTPSGAKSVVGDGDVYIRADGKKVRRVRKSAASVSGDPEKKSLSGFLEKDGPSKPKLGGSASVAGDQLAVRKESSLTGEVYVRADGKKVRRVLKKPASAASSTDENVEIITRPDGTKVRRIRRTKPTESPAEGDPAPVSSEEAEKKSGGLSGFLDRGAPAKPKGFSGSHSVAGDQLASRPKAQEGEIYIRADGKKVRRIRKTKPDDSDAPGSTLAGFLGASSDGKPRGGAATVVGDVTAPKEETEIYVRPDGTKVRRIKRTSQSSDTGVPEKKSLGGFLEKGAVGKKMMGGSASVAGDQIAVDKSSSLTGEVYIRADGKKVRRVKKSSASVGPNDEVEIITRPDGTKVRRIKRAKPKEDDNTLGGFLSSQPGGAPKGGSATVAGDVVTASEAAKKSLPTGAADDSKLEENKRTLSGFLDRMETDRPKKMMGGSASVAGDQIAVSKNASLTGEVYVRADGKKVRRVKKPTAAGPGDQVEIITRPDGTKVRRIKRAKKPEDSEGGDGMTLGDHLGDSSQQKATGSATVAGDGGGEIYIRADGKKVRRIRKSAAPAASDEAYEIYVRPDGKKVRRIKRSALAAAPVDTDKPADSDVGDSSNDKSLGSMLSKDEQAEAKGRSANTVAGDDITGKSSLGQPGDGLTPSEEGWVKPLEEVDAPPAVQAESTPMPASPQEPPSPAAVGTDEQQTPAAEPAVQQDAPPTEQAATPQETPAPEGTAEQQQPGEQHSVPPIPPEKVPEGMQLVPADQVLKLPDDSGTPPGMAMIPEGQDVPAGMKLVPQDQAVVPEGMVLVTKEQAEHTLPEGMVAVPKDSAAIPDGFVLVPKDKVRGDIGDDLVLVNRNQVKSEGEQDSSKPNIVMWLGGNEGEPNKEGEANSSKDDVDISGANIVSMEDLPQRMEQLRAGGDAPKFLLQPLPSNADLRDDFIKKNLLPKDTPAPPPPPPPPPKKAEPSESIAALLAQMSTMENFDGEKMGELLNKLQEAEKRQKKLEKQLAAAGVAIAEDIDYDTCIKKVGEIGKRMNEIGGSDVTREDKEEQNRLREEYFKLEQEMEKYNSALMLTDEYQAEQDRLEKKWETDNAPGNVEALKKIRRHMPVEVRNMSEAMLTNEPSPNGMYLPKGTAKKFKRTNVLQLIRRAPDDIIRMHPSTLENMRVTGLTLTERRALYAHLLPCGPAWKAQKAEKMTERKWTWYNMMKNNFKENLASWQRHVDQYGPPGAHPYATRANPNEGCPLIGKQCPLKADKLVDYDGDYGWPDGDEYEVSEVKKADADDPGAKAMAEALALAKEKKANERADALKTHYKGKLLQVAKANGSCESMDEAMDKMEFGMIKWIEDIVRMGDDKSKLTDDVIKKEVAGFTDVLNDVKLLTLDFCGRSGMQLSGKKKAGDEAPDPRSAIECFLSEEVIETFGIFSKFVTNRLKKTEQIDTRIQSTIKMLNDLLQELHGRNTATAAALGATKPERSRKLKTVESLEEEAKKKLAEQEPPPGEEEAGGGGPMGMPGPPRGGLMDAIKGTHDLCLVMFIFQ